jgi:hypothetical protein
MKTTEWFPASIRPVHTGFYEFKLPGLHEPIMAHWDRIQGWTYRGSNLHVYKFYDKWRGLTERAA